MERVKFVDYNQMPDVDLQPIHQAILQEKALLHPSLVSLEESFQQKMSVVMVDGENPVGHVRFSPLLDGNLKDQLGLSEDFPDIWEIGSAIIMNNPEYRGKGYYATLRNTLLETTREKVFQHQLLILGTTKSMAVVRVLPKAQSIGMGFNPCLHLDYPFIAPFTCVCEGEFGQGLHLSPFCPSRAKSVVVQETGGKIPCLMYVSSENLAKEMNLQLQNHFKSMDDLVRSLRDMGYYQ